VYVIYITKQHEFSNPDPVNSKPASRLGNRPITKLCSKAAAKENILLPKPPCLDIFSQAISFRGLIMSARFQEAVLLRLPTGLREAIDRAADAEHSKRTDFIRRAIVERLRKDGRARASQAAEARV
jgi:hypothetical protein